MRYAQILAEDLPANTISTSLKKQADAKSDQAKKLKQQASVAKKREQINRSRSSMNKTQSALTALLSKPTQ